MKKICYLADASNPHTIKWCNYFKNKGYEVHVISLNEGEINGVNVYNFTFNVKELKNKSSFKKIKYITAINQIKELIKSIKPDILHAHYASSYGLIGALLNYHPYIISVWGTDIYDFPNSGPIHKTIIKYNLKKADYIFSTSNDMAKETGKYTNKKIYITPFGVDMDVFYPMTKSNNKSEFVVGTIKTLEKKYGIDYLIKGFKEVKNHYRDKDITLRIAGSGSQENTLKKLVEELNIVQNVEFLGRIPLDAVAREFNNLDVAVFPSLRESFGVAAVEAQSCGIPVIVSDVGGHPEVVLNNKTGIIVESESVKDIKNALIRIIDNKELRIDMGIKGRKFIGKNYEINSNFERVEEIYNNIIKNV